MPLAPTAEETACRDRVMAAILDHIERGITIRLPAYDASISVPSPHGALLSVGHEPNLFGATVGDFRYQFEGEEDLLHLFVTRLDGSPIDSADGLAVAQFLMPTVPPALVWHKPGEFSQHFYVGHDDLL